MHMILSIVGKVHESLLLYIPGRVHSPLTEWLVLTRLNPGIPLCHAGYVSLLSPLCGPAFVSIYTQWHLAASFNVSSKLTKYARETETFAFATIRSGQSAAILVW